MLRTLREAGFPPEITYHAFHALDAHILGFTLWQLGHGLIDQKQLEDLAATFLQTFPLDEVSLHARARPAAHDGIRARGEGRVRARPGSLILDGLERFGDAA